MICPKCSREVTVLRTHWRDGEMDEACLRCIPPERVYPLDGINKHGYTVTPAYYDNITSRRSVYEGGEHNVIHYKGTKHFVMGA